MVCPVNAISRVYAGRDQAPDHRKWSIKQTECINFVRVNLTGCDALRKFDDIQGDACDNMTDSIGDLGEERPCGIENPFLTSTSIQFMVICYVCQGPT